MTLYRVTHFQEGESAKKGGTEAGVQLWIQAT